MAKRGAKKKKINFEELEKLCELQCTRNEICQWFGVTDKTLSARIKEKYGINFSAYFEQKRGKGKVALRRAQFQNALAGNTSMQIWLGKQYLEQKDKQELTGADGGPMETKVTVEFIAPDDNND